MSDTDEKEIAQTISEYRVMAAKTGEWRGFQQSFSNDGVTWADYLLPTFEHPHPLLASATVHRAGFAVPIRVVIGWDESVPAEDEWRELWERSPHALFGAAAARLAYIRAFPEVITSKPSGDERKIAAPVVENSHAVARNWDVELDAAATVDEVAALWAAARKARAVTVPLERAFKVRRDEILKAAVAELAPAVPAVAAVRAAPSPAQVAAAARRSRERSAA